MTHRGASSRLIIYIALPFINNDYTGLWSLNRSYQVNFFQCCITANPMSRSLFQFFVHSFHFIFQFYSQTKRNNSKWRTRPISVDFTWALPIDRSSNQPRDKPYHQTWERTIYYILSRVLRDFKPLCRLVGPSDRGQLLIDILMYGG